MRYYIYRDGESVVGWHQTDKALPPPAIEVSKSEFVALGLYTELEEPEQAQAEPSVWDEMAAAYQKGVQEA